MTGVWLIHWCNAVETVNSPNTGVSSGTSSMQQRPSRRITEPSKRGLKASTMGVRRPPPSKIQYHQAVTRILATQSFSRRKAETLPLKQARCPLNSLNNYSAGLRTIKNIRKQEKSHKLQ